MAGTTTNYALPYPTGTDQPCDGWQFIQDLAEAIAPRLDSFDTDQQRFEVVPFARLSNSVPVTQNLLTGALPWDTIDIDVTGMVDLGYDFEAIHAPAAGLWMVGGYARHSTSGTAGNLLELSVVKGVSTVTRSDGRDNGPGWEGKLSASEVDNGLEGDGYGVSLGQAGITPAVPSVTVSRMFMFWVGDTP
jgi:hypothetical protein